MAEVIAGYAGVDEPEYRRRIRAWQLYDWANSAFATTILAAVLPVYYSQVAGKTLSSPATATAYWTATLSISLLLVAVLAPIFGTISDLKRGKKKLLAASILIGSLGTALLVLVSTGDWLMASLFFMIARLGFAGGNVFYDALLPHVAREEDQDRVSTMGFAVGYLGGGLLLAINVSMIFTLGSELGARLSFFSFAVSRDHRSDPGGAGRNGAVLRAGGSHDHETYDHLGPRRLRRHCRVGLRARYRHRILVPGVHGRRRPGRIPSTESESLCLDVADRRIR
jgi:MFS-type transporter involved in bile tolerance (Atg22 family)